MEFPRLVYKGPAIHKPVDNEKEHAEAMADGWYHSVPEALAKKHAPRPDFSVTVYKSVDGKIESFKASNTEEAKMFIEADGWHATAKEAAAAALKAEWPADAAAIETQIGALSSKKKADILAYAARIGAPVVEDSKASEMLEVIKARLMAGPGAEASA